MWSLHFTGHVNFNFLIPPYGVNVRTRGLALWCTGHFLFYSAIRCKWSVYDFWPYGVQDIFIFLFRHTVLMVGLEEWPYGVQGIFNFIPPYGVNVRCIIFGPMVYRAFVFVLFRHTV